MPGQVDEAVKDERLSRLLALILEQQGAFNAATVGRTAPVLFEKAGRRTGQVVGKTPWLQAVHVDGPASLIGHIAPVTFTATAPNSLAGVLATVTA